MNSGEVATIVAIVSMLLNYFGAAVDPTVITNAVQGFFAIVTFCGLLWSWYIHRENRTS